ncbi:RNA polymerase II transcription factor B subunit 3 [Cytospora mali]|uniref:RNA polymerase II transcription factor B subunit 3 n=1 Tax=Cytospora mali TaxID=578113 RepID=A0A194UZP0_CYTMA|nr:RNA polymerase II transcription factor B subunit 3 [Valsa mali var. pyri (nom. inval.)]
MSRKPNTGPIPASSSASSAAPISTSLTNQSGEEQCPICKTLRYMNKSMRFLINPECYHALCNNCVDRLFENGPNQCPYIGCHKTLRKKAFREPTFGDLSVEREVDIRRRVAAVFNKTEDEFEDLASFNEYLEMVESLTMDLVYGAAGAQGAAEEKLLQWEEHHRAEIERNKRAGEKARESTRRQIAAEKEAARQRRMEAVRAEEEEKLERVRQREEDLDTLARAPQGQAARVMLKKRGQHRKEELAASEAAALRRAAAAAGGGLSIRGLKKKGGDAGGSGSGSDADSGPYDPFGRLDLRSSRYELQREYKNPFLDGARRDHKYTAGGYDLQEYYSRSMFEAFAGLAVFIGDEKETGQVGVDLRDIATEGAGLAAGQADGPADEKAKREVKREITEIKKETDRETAEASLKQEAQQQFQGPVVKKEEPVTVKMEVDDY